jgi:hypothetical protein
MNELELIRRARRRIEKGWTQGAYARDSRGSLIASDSPEASCWCVLGALGEDVRGSHESELVDPIYARLHGLIDCDSLALWNDAPDMTQERVLEVFKKAEQEILAVQSNG